MARKKKKQSKKTKKRKQSSQSKQGGGRKRQPTAAQRAASRRNGARSQGPVTQAGKDTSRQNAVKHGLLSTLTRPPTDHRGHDRLYEQIREQLQAEYQPASFTQHAAIDAAASLYLQWARAQQMIEELMRPEAVSERDQTEIDRNNARTTSLDLLDRVAADFEACKSSLGPYDESEAHRLAELIESLCNEVTDYEQEQEGVAALADVLAKHPPPDPRQFTDPDEARQAWDTYCQQHGCDPPSIDPAYSIPTETHGQRLLVAAGCQAELQKGEVTAEGVDDAKAAMVPVDDMNDVLEGLINTVGREFFTELNDHARLVEIFSGKPPGKKQRRAIEQIVEHLRSHMFRGSSPSESRARGRVDAAQSAVMRHLAEEPERLVLLHRYQRQIEWSIRSHLHSAATRDTVEMPM